MAACNLCSTADRPSCKAACNGATGAERWRRTGGSCRDSQMPERSSRGAVRNAPTSGRDSAEGLNGLPKECRQVRQTTFKQADHLVAPSCRRMAGMQLQRLAGQPRWSAVPSPKSCAHLDHRFLRLQHRPLHTGSCRCGSLAWRQAFLRLCTHCILCSFAW